MPSSFNKWLRSAEQEEVCSENLICRAEFLLRLLKIKVDIECTDKFRDRILVFVSLLLDDSNKIFHLLLIACAPACGIPSGRGSVAPSDNSNCEISKDPGTGRLNSVDIGRGKEEVDEGVSRRVMVEERKQSPMQEPCAVM